MSSLQNRVEQMHAPELRPHIAALYNSFRYFNSVYFRDKLQTPAIFLDRNVWETKGQVVYYGSAPFVIIVERGLVDYCGDRDPLRFAKDTLLHEMIHLHLWKKTHDHGARFTRQVNRIGRRMGLPPVSSSGRGRPPSWCWPACVRGAEHNAELESIQCRIRLARVKESMRNSGILFSDAEAIDILQNFAEIERVLCRGEYQGLLLLDQLVGKISEKTGLHYRTEAAFLREMKQKYSQIFVGTLNAS